MNIYENFSKKNLEKKKISIFFSKPLNKKEQNFLKFLFIDYNFKTNIEKSNNFYNLNLNKIMKTLKYTKIEQLEKFLNNLQSKKINFNIKNHSEHLITGSFPIISSYSINYSKINFILAYELYLSKKEKNLFSLLRPDFLVFMGDENYYNFYSHIISTDYSNIIEFSLSQLKEIFNVKEKYKRFFDFENKVLKKAVNSINTFSDIKIEYKKIKVGEYKNNKVEKIIFIVSHKNNIIPKDKNKKLLNNIDFFIDMIKNRIKNYSNIQELLKSYLIKKDFEYVYNNVLFAKNNFKNNFEKNLKKSLLLDLAYASRVNTEKEIINIRKKYNTPFFLQLDFSSLMKKYRLDEQFKTILNTGVLNELLILKDEQIYEKKFENFRIYIQYFKKKESIIRLWTY